MEKHEWRKKEKNVYLAKRKPEIIDIPAFKFVSIKGAGNPNSKSFSEYIGVLYAISYAIKMTLKKMDPKPEGYFDFTVYPLEGVWDITDEAKKRNDESLNKDDLIFDLMIRQPDFVTKDIYDQMLELVKKKKPHPLLKQLKFGSSEEGKCVQMLHLGSYDDEPKSFEQMEVFMGLNNLIRPSKKHREIYLSDFRKVEEEKLKTVLRFKVG